MTNELKEIDFIFLKDITNITSTIYDTYLILINLEKNNEQKTREYTIKLDTLTILLNKEMIIYQKLNKKRINLLINYLNQLSKNLLEEHTKYDYIVTKLDKAFILKRIYNKLKDLKISYQIELNQEKENNSYEYENIMLMYKKYLKQDISSLLLYLTKEDEELKYSISFLNFDIEKDMVYNKFKTIDKVYLLSTLFSAYLSEFDKKQLEIFYLKKYLENYIDKINKDELLKNYLKIILIFLKNEDLEIIDKIHDIIDINDDKNIIRWENIDGNSKRFL